MEENVDWKKVPKGVWIAILAENKIVDLNDLFSFSLCCKYFREIVKNDFLWKQFWENKLRPPAFDERFLEGKELLYLQICQKYRNYKKYLCITPGLAHNVREKPGMDSKVIGLIDPNTFVFGDSVVKGTCKKTKGELFVRLAKESLEELLITQKEGFSLISLGVIYLQEIKDANHKK